MDLRATPVRNRLELLVGQLVVLSMQDDYAYELPEA